MMSGTLRQLPDDCIAITGMGVLSPIGQGIEAFWFGVSVTTASPVSPLSSVFRPTTCVCVVAARSSSYEAR